MSETRTRAFRDSVNAVERIRALSGEANASRYIVAILDANLSSMETLAKKNGWTQDETAAAMLSLITSKGPQIKVRVSEARR